MSRRIARPYAAALFQILEPHGVAAMREAEAQLAAVAEACTQERRFLRVFEVPSVPPGVKRAVLQELGTKLRLRAEVQRLLAALMHHYRLRWLGDVAETFRAMVDAREGMVRGVLQVPEPPSATQREMLETALADVVGCRVELAVEQRPELIAGFVVRIGSRVFDGSVRTQLARFARSGAGASA